MQDTPDTVQLKEMQAMNSGIPRNIQNYLDGKKTIIGIIAGMLYSALIYFNVVSSNELAWAAIAGFTGISARLAISKAGRPL